MSTEVYSIFLTKKEKLKCKECGSPVPKGAPFVAEGENKKGTCFACSPFEGYAFLPPGDAAMTRRSKRLSDKCGVVFEWNQRRKRFERKGQYVLQSAIEEAIRECVQDAHIRAEKNAKAAVKRAEEDKIYIKLFSIAIRKRYPSCPTGREYKIAEHACEKHSGRVGRTASAKEFDSNMIDLAVEAHIRHIETNYDDQFGKGLRKREIRNQVKTDVNKVMAKWKL